MSFEITGSDEAKREALRRWTIERRRARRLAMIVVFAHIHTKYPFAEIELLVSEMAQGWRSFPPFAKELIRTVEQKKPQLEAELQQVLEHWKLERIGKVEHALLLLGAAEIASFPNIPPRVTINEYIEISKKYCDEETPGFINGVLDKITKLHGKRDFYVRPPA
ncbi:MAG: transcription antitermination factor NusB [Candidatus Sumerlaeaceae bacterium]